MHKVFAHFPVLRNSLNLIFVSLKTYDDLFNDIKTYDNLFNEKRSANMPKRFFIRNVRIFNFLFRVDFLFDWG